MHDDPATTESIDPLQIELLGDPAVTQQRSRACLDSGRPIGAAELRPHRELSGRLERQLSLAATAGGLAQLGQRPHAEPELAEAAVRSGERELALEAAGQLAV